MIPAKPSSRGTEASPGQQRKRRPVFIFLIPLVIAILLAGWQVLSHRDSTDPTIAGRPLSNPQTHLHTVVPGGKAGVIYLGTHFGMFTSTDDGQTWPQPRGVLNRLMVTVIAVNPKDARSLALLGVPSVSGGDPAGVYFSADGGSTWSLRRPSGVSASAYPFTVRAGSATAGHFYAFYLYHGWFETRDLGLHWRPLSASPLPNTQGQKLLTFPGDPAHLLLGGNAGLFESRDDGAHWSTISAVQGSVQELAASQDTPARIFCATDQGLYTWRDGTAQITTLATPTTTPFSQLISDATGSVLYGLTGRDLWYSTDGGKSWQHRWRFNRSDLVALVMDPQHPTRLYAGFFLPATVLTSSDGGLSWHILTD